jgi:predicted TIM-barrel fold metal-dependent hydrolase
MYEWMKGPNQLKIHLAGDLTPIRKNYFVADLLHDAKDIKVEKGVHLQAECSDEVGETKWLQSVADKHGMFR